MGGWTLAKKRLVADVVRAIGVTVPTVQPEWTLIGMLKHLVSWTKNKATANPQCVPFISHECIDGKFSILPTVAWVKTITRETTQRDHGDVGNYEIKVRQSRIIESWISIRARRFWFPYLLLLLLLF